MLIKSSSGHLSGLTKRAFQVRGGRRGFLRNEAAVFTSSQQSIMEYALRGISTPRYPLSCSFLYRYSLIMRHKITNTSFVVGIAFFSNATAHIYSNCAHFFVSTCLACPAWPLPLHNHSLSLTRECRVQYSIVPLSVGTLLQRSCIWRASGQKCVPRQGV